MNKYNILDYFTTKNNNANNQSLSYLDNISNIPLNSLKFKKLSNFFKADYTDNYSNEILLEKTYTSK